MSDVPKVRENPTLSRFEIQVDGELAELAYRQRAGRLVIVHTEVPESLAGHGFGGMLVQAAVTKAVAEGLTIVPLCPFAHSWLKRHPGTASTVTIDWSKPAAH